MHSNKTILFCPLNWGLGHASRIVPLIKKHINEGYTVLLASDGDALRFLQRQFPELQSFELPALQIRYWNTVGMAVSIFLQLAKLITWMRADHKAIAKIADSNTIDIIYSDNRWGAWHKNVYSIFMTHQLMVKLPLVLRVFEKTLSVLQFFIIRHFNEIQIPDFEDKNNNLSGDLSHKYLPKNKTTFIGPLTRLQKEKEPSHMKYDIAVIISGPEPQRSIFELLITKNLKKSNLQFIIIAGKPNESFNNEHYKSFATDSELNTIIQNARLIICRAGYSSIMDLFLLQKTAILIPTPRQTEQEYLAKYLHKHNNFSFLTQKKIENTDFRKYVNTSIPA